MTLHQQLKNNGWPDGRSIAKLGLLDAVLKETGFLSDDAKMSQRLFCIHEGLSHPPLCPVCGSPNVYSRKKLYSHVPYGGWSLYCSKECTYKSDQRKEKFEQSMIASHGVPYSGMSETINEKRNQSMIERYGETVPLRVEQIKNKQAETMKSRYGGYTFASEPLSLKASSTMMERFGVAYARMNEEVNDKARKTLIDRFGGPTPLASPVVREKVSETLKSKSNEERDSIRARTSSTSLERYNRTYYQRRHMLDSVDRLLNDKEELVRLYHELGSLEALGRHLEVDPKTIRSILSDIKLVDSWNRSLGETELCDYLTSLGAEIETNVRGVIPNYEIDILVKGQNLLIEYNGIYWHSTKFKDKNYHKKKADLAEELGYQLIQVWEDDWAHSQKRKILESKFAHLLGCSGSSSIYGRLTTISKIPYSEASKFLNLYHLQGERTGSEYIGLFFDGSLVAVMVLLKKKQAITIARYATSSQVLGGFSKLLAYVKKVYDWDQIVTYADRTISTGDLYHKTGFMLERITPPGLWYVKGNNRFRREAFMKHKLPLLFQSVDLSKTEEEIMLENGYLTLFDAGLLKFVMYNQSDK